MRRPGPKSAVAPFVILAIFLSSSAGASSHHRSPTPRTPKSLSYAPAEVVVIADGEALNDARVSPVLAAFGLAQARRLDPSPRHHIERRERVWILRSTLPDFDPLSAARALEATGAFRAVTPNYRFSLLLTQPDDPYLPYQWYVDDGGIADVGLPFAWDLERGDTSVVIAIMDTGVDTTHPDLMSRIWHNPGEIPGNGIDDDGNGFIDDTEGWDFGVGDNDPKPEYTSDISGIDVGFHGTFCAGIAAAATDNGDGIAGAGWNTRIMPLKVSNPDSGLTSGAIAGAFVYAVDQRASVISMSFGGPGDPGVPEFFQALVDMATRSGILCVAAAGNDGDSVRVYPGACDRVLAVAATDPSNARADFSNWGPWVDIAAPGSTMWSTISQNYEFSELDQLFYEFLFLWDGFNPYMYGDGTSFACPLTAGVCCLVRARYPNLTPELVAQHVISSGDDVPYDHPVGPKLNAFRAVSSIPTAVAEGPVPALARLFATPNPMTGSARIRFDLPAEGWTRLHLFDASGRRVRTIAEGPMRAGPHVLSWDGLDDRGVRLPAAVYFARLEGSGTILRTKVVLLGW